MISVVLYGRNDSHGYNLHKRAAISLNAIAEVLTHRNDEILFVDYNTPDDLPTFLEAIQDTLTDRAKRILRVLRVRPCVHQPFEKKTHLVAIEPIARNVAIRRSNPANRWVLSTNTDMIFVPRRRNRSLSDVASELSDGFFQLPRFELPESLWESFDRRDPRAIIDQTAEWGRRFHLNDVVYGSSTILYDAPGDFQLALRDDIISIDGFNEEMILGWHVDANLCRRMTILRGQVNSALPGLFGYHCDHTRQATLMHGRDRVENDSRHFVDKVSRADLPMQRDTWGLPNHPIEELTLRGNVFGRYMRALDTALQSAAPVPFYCSSYTADSYNDLTYVPEHVLAFLCDQLSTLPLEQSLLFTGCRPRMFELLKSAWEAFGFKGDILLPTELTWFSETIGLGIRRGTLEQLCDYADVFVFEFGRASDDDLLSNPIQRTSDSPSPIDQLSSEDEERLAIVRDAFIRGNTIELQQRVQMGRAPRRFVALNVINNQFESLITDTLSYTYTPYSSRTRHGYVILGQQQSALRLDPRYLTTWLQEALGRSKPIPLTEISRLLEILREVAGSGTDNDLPPEAGTCATSLLALLRFPGIQSLVPMDESLLKSLPQRIEEARGSVKVFNSVDIVALEEELIQGPRSGFASLGDWEDPNWFAHARRHFGGLRAYDVFERSQWVWQRTSILHALDDSGLLNESARTLVFVTCREDFSAVLADLMGEVHVIGAARDANGLLRSAPRQLRRPNRICRTSRLKYLDGGESFLNFYDAVILPHGAAVADDLIGLPMLMRDADRSLKIGGIIGFTLDVVIDGVPSPSQLDVDLARRTGLLKLLQNWTGLRAIGTHREKISRETLDRTDCASHSDLNCNHFVALESGRRVAGSLFLFQKQTQTKDSGWLKLARALAAREMSNVWIRMKDGPEAKREQNGFVTAQKGRSVGLLLYGPYIRLAAGTYRINVEAAALNAKRRDTGVLRVDVVARDVVLASKIFTSSDLRSSPFGLDFTIPKKFGVGTGPSAPVEFLCFHTGAANLRLKSLSLKAVTGVRRHTATKMKGPISILSCFHLNDIGAIDDTGARVLRHEKPGCWLYGPYIHLSPGFYEVLFSCGVEQFDPQQPALAVEVIATGGELFPLQEFTPDRLRDCVQLPFEVKAQGDAMLTNMEVRFWHRGTADLVLTEVVLKPRNPDDQLGICK